MLDEAAEIPVLEELEVWWAEEEGGRDVLFKQRHKERIEGACRNLGVRVQVGKSDVGLKGW